MGHHQTKLDGEKPREYDFSLAVLPFENFSNNPDVGHSMSQLIADELINRKVFKIQDKKETQHILLASKVDLDRLDDISLARNFAQLLGVDAVMLGSVPEFSYQHGLREDPTVGLRVQLIRAHDGLVLWHGSQALAGSGYWQRQSAVYVAQDAVTRLVDSLVQAAEPDWLPPKAVTEKTANRVPLGLLFKG
ncbi:MAG: hypothetical protein HQL63_09225 [Magnetococcales bacterium]|nr:hypothetical protein [Magnetococcales bacterium]MBF0322346.1 hypothetical protein [Magnetococcales bacterium]